MRVAGKQRRSTPGPIRAAEVKTRNIDPSLRKNACFSPAPESPAIEKSRILRDMASHAIPDPTRNQRIELSARERITRSPSCHQSTQLISLEQFQSGSRCRPAVPGVCLGAQQAAVRSGHDENSISCPWSKPKPVHQPLGAVIGIARTLNTTAILGIRAARRHPGQASRQLPAPAARNGFRRIDPVGPAPRATLRMRIDQKRKSCRPAPQYRWRPSWLTKNTDRFPPSPPPHRQSPFGI